MAVSSSLPLYLPGEGQCSRPSVINCRTADGRVNE